MARKNNKNHHLELRGNAWDFIKMVNGERVRKTLSTSVTEARHIRDQYLRDILLYGEITSLKPDQSETSKDGKLFGEVAVEWVKRQEERIVKNQIKHSTLRDWRSSLNGRILPHFGNTLIDEISLDSIDDFIDQLKCGPKRVNNILVPIRSIFKYAKRRAYIAENIMADVDNMKIEKADINPLNHEEVLVFLDTVNAHYRNMFCVGFYQGMRFGEIAALKWKNVDFKRKLIHVKETRVDGVEGRPKTSSSVRDIDMLPPVLKALLEQKKKSGKDKYVFRDMNDMLLTADHVREVIWKPALKQAGIVYRPMIQTRHTFATMMIDAGENIGWVQRMMGHGSLQMIFTKYYSWMKNETQDNGSAFMKKVYNTGTVVEDDDLPG